MKTTGVGPSGEWTGDCEIGRRILLNDCLLPVEI